MANEEETTTGQPQSQQAGQQTASAASGLQDDNSLVQLLALVLLAAFAPMDSRAPHKASQEPHHAVRDAISDAERGAWKDLEVALTKYYRKGHEHQDVTRLVANSVKEEEVGLSGLLSPESRRHALGVDVESLSVLSERQDRKRAGIQEPTIDLKEALAERRQSAKLWHIKVLGESEAEANKSVAAFVVREEKVIRELRKEGVSDSDIAQSLSDSSEAHRRYFAKLDAKSHEHSAAHSRAPKTLEEAAREFAKHAPKLPTDPQELAKRPTGHPEGHFHPESTGLSQANRNPPGRGSSRG
jgi:hypothetical protein